MLEKFTDATTSRLSLERVFSLMAWRFRDRIVCKSLEAWGWHDPHGLPFHRRLASVIATAFGETLEEAGDFIQWAFRRAVGSTSDTAPAYRGLRTFAEPLAVVSQYAALVLARTNDLDHMHRAYVSGVLARLRAGQTNEAIAWAQQLQDRQPRNWSALVDRPLAWSIPVLTGSPADCLELMRQHRVQVESCRLTLALRLYREIHGAWPDSLSQLKSDILPSIPLDPYSGQPFLYQRIEGEYLFASVGPENRSPGWLLSTNRLTAYDESRPRVFSSTDPALRLAEWQQMRSQQRRMWSVQLLQRYGLLPRTPQVSAPPLTNALPPSTHTAH